VDGIDDSDDSDEICDVTITAASAEWLAGWVRGLVEERLAACGNIDAGTVRSIYRWEGRIEDEEEARVTLHTRRSLVPEIIARADRDHPYDTPQVLAVPVVAAHPGYRRWVLESTRPA
jgi:periplasmic divalent cation tolerance protein